MEAKLNKWLKRLGRLVVTGAAAYGTARVLAYYLASQANAEFEHAPAVPSQSVPPGSLVFVKHSCSKAFSYQAVKSCLVHQAYKKYVTNRNCIT